MTTTKTATTGEQVVQGFRISPEAAVAMPWTQNRCRCRLSGNTCIAPSTGQPNWIVGTTAMIRSAS